MKFIVRSFKLSEYDAIIDVFKSTIPGFLGTAESLRESDARPLFVGPRARFVAEIDGDVAQSYAKYRHYCYDGVFA